MSVLQWLRESLTGTGSSPAPPWKFPPLPERDDSRPAPGFEPLDLPDQAAEPPRTTQHYIVHPVRSAEETERLLDPATPGNLWQPVIGHDAAKRSLNRIAGRALQREDHRCDTSIILVGPSSADRMALARAFARHVLMLPFVELDAAVLAANRVPLAYILLAVAKTLESWNEEWLARGGVADDGLGMALVQLDDYSYHPPPIVVFIDGAEKLPKTVKNALLKATDPADRVIVSELGHTIRCERICWILRTTELGLLGDAFADRFDVVAV